MKPFLVKRARLVRGVVSLVFMAAIALDVVGAMALDNSETGPSTGGCDGHGAKPVCATCSNGACVAVCVGAVLCNETYEGKNDRPSVCSAPGSGCTSGGAGGGSVALSARDKAAIDFVDEQFERQIAPHLGSCGVRFSSVGSMTFVHEYARSGSAWMPGGCDAGVTLEESKLPAAEVQRALACVRTFAANSRLPVSAGDGAETTKVIHWTWPTASFDALMSIELLSVQTLQVLSPRTARIRETGKYSIDVTCNASLETNAQGLRCSSGMKLRGEKK